MISLDLETEPIRPGVQAPRPVLAQTVGAIEPGLTDLVRDGVLLCRPGSPTFCELGQVIAREYVVGQNLPFDLGVLIEWGHARVEDVFAALDAGRVRSVDTRQRLLDIADGCYGRHKFDLGALAKRYGIGGIEKDNPWRLRFSELENVPWAEWPEIALEYATRDAGAPLEIFQAQEQERARITESAGADPLVDEARSLRAQWALWLVAAHGVVPDREALEYYGAWIERRKRAARSVLLRAGLLRLERGEYKKRTKDMREIVVRAWTKHEGRATLGEWLRARGESAAEFAARSGLSAEFVERHMGGFSQLGVDPNLAKRVLDATEGQIAPYPRTNSGKYPSLDSGVATALELPELDAWLEYGSAVSAESRWTELAHGIVHTRFRQAESGRSRSSGPNLQNRPRKGPDRECFAPGQGLVYLVTDHDQLELSTVAQALIAFGCGDNLARAINGGLDGHLVLAADLLHTTYEDAVARYRRGEREAKNMRQLAKVANFGFPGGLGAERFVAYVYQQTGKEISVEESRWLKRTWLGRWTEFRRYFDLVGRATKSGRGAVQQLYSGRLRGGVGFTDACNTFFQGLGADLTSDVLYELQRDTRRETSLDPREVVEAWMEQRAECDRALETGTREFVLRAWKMGAVEELARKLGTIPRDLTACALAGARTENYVHDEYLLTVTYRPVLEGALVVDPLLELRALAKEYVVRTVAERWLPDLRPTATATASVRWSKTARDVRDERGRPVVWEVCDEVDEVARVFGDRDAEQSAGSWARSVCERARGADPVRLHARLAGLVPGYRRVPSDRDVERAIEESRT